MIVVDASVVAPALADDDSSGDQARARLAGEELSAPELVYLEVVSVIRASANAGNLDGRRARLAMEDLYALPVQAVRHRDLLHRVWELRHNVTSHDAAYVALAELLDATLVTADVRLANASGPRCKFEVLAA